MNCAVVCVTELLGSKAIFGNLYLLRDMVYNKQLSRHYNPCLLPHVCITLQYLIFCVDRP